MINGWDKLPDEIVEKILMQAIKSYETYSNIINSCSRLQIIEKTEKCCFLILISNQVTILRSHLMESSR